MRGDRLNKERRAELNKAKELHCDICPPNRGENAKRQDNRKFNKTKRGGKRGFED